MRPPCDRSAATRRPLTGRSKTAHPHPHPFQSHYDHPVCFCCHSDSKGEARVSPFSNTGRAFRSSHPHAAAASREHQGKDRAMGAHLEQRGTIAAFTRGDTALLARQEPARPGADHDGDPAPFPAHMARMGAPRAERPRQDSPLQERHHPAVFLRSSKGASRCTTGEKSVQVLLVRFIHRATRDKSIGRIRSSFPFLRLTARLQARKGTQGLPADASLQDAAEALPRNTFAPCSPGEGGDTRRM